jgi:hypothetical protein
MKRLLLILLLFTACSKESIEICGTITGGDYDYINNMYYLRVDGKRHWVDMKTYESYFVGDFICLESF